MSDPRIVRRKIATFARELRTEFSRELARDPRGFKERIIRLIRRELPPDQAVTRAAAMRQQGKNWQQIYAACLPDTQDNNSRRVAQWQLRDAVRKRLGVRRRRKKTRSDCSARKNPPPIVPSSATPDSPLH